MHKAPCVVVLKCFLEYYKIKESQYFLGFSWVSNASLIMLHDGELCYVKVTHELTIYWFFHENSANSFADLLDIAALNNIRIWLVVK